MNHLSLRTISTALDDGQPYQAIEIVVDGNSVMELVRAIEAPFARREGSPQIAGSYAWIPRSPKTIRALQGEPGDVEGKVPLLECSCGVWGCWPLLARISVEQDVVIWSEFEQPHRGPEAVAGHWTYEALEPLVFARPQYEAELRAIA